MFELSTKHPSKTTQKCQKNQPSTSIKHLNLQNCPTKKNHFAIMVPSFFSKKYPQKSQKNPAEVLPSPRKIQWSPQRPLQTPSAAPLRCPPAALRPAPAAAARPPRCWSWLGGRCSSRPWHEPGETWDVWTLEVGENWGCFHGELLRGFNGSLADV